MLVGIETPEMQDVEIAVARPEIQRLGIDAQTLQNLKGPLHLDIKASKGEGMWLAGNYADFHAIAATRQPADW